MEQRDSNLRIYQETELKGIRKIISNRLSSVWREAIHVTLHKEIDVSPFYENRKRLEHSFIDYLLYGLLETLKLPEHKKINSHFEEGVIRTFDSINLGLAVDHPKGLVVPVVHHADQLDLGEFSSKRKELISRTKMWKQTPQELENGTFTTSNLGTMGIDYFTPILNPPQVAILGFGRVRMQLISWEWGEDPIPRAMLPLSMTVDHRVIDGADAAKFLSEYETGFAKLLEREGSKE